MITMAEKGETKIIAISTICIMLISIGLCGCITSTDLGITPDEPTKHPQNPIITVDNNGTAYILWNIYLSGKYYLKFIAITKDGKKINEKTICETDVRFPKLVKDTNENFHILFDDGSISYHYLKIDNKGEILIEKSLKEINSYSEQLWGEHFDFSIDMNNNLYILCLLQNNNILYVKLDSFGEVLNIENLGNFIKNISDLRVTGYSSIHIGIDSHGILWAIWLTGSNTYNINSSEIGGINKTLSGNAIKVGVSGNIYILSGNYIKKLNNSGILLNNKPIQEVTPINNYPIVKDDDGKLIYLRDNGCVDNNNVHLVTEKIETKILGSGHYQTEGNFHTLYYSKIDSNGSKLIDKMIIDTDGKPEDYEFNILNSMPCLLLITISLIFIIIIILYIFQKVKKIRR